MYIYLSIYLSMSMFPSIYLSKPKTPTLKSGKEVSLCFSLTNVVDNPLRPDFVLAPLALRTCVTLHVQPLPTPYRGISLIRNKGSTVVLRGGCFLAALPASPSTYEPLRPECKVAAVRCNTGI